LKKYSAGFLILNLGKEHGDPPEKSVS